MRSCFACHFLIVYRWFRYLCPDPTKPFEQHVRSENERLFYNTDFELCLSNDGQPISTGCVTPISLPMAGDFDFMCINNDKSLVPIIMPGDVIAQKELAT